MAEENYGPEEQPDDHKQNDIPVQDHAGYAEESRVPPNIPEPSEEPIVETGQVAARGAASFFGALPVAWLTLAKGFASLRHTNFRIFWFTQLISLIGTWMQGLAQSWLVLDITGSPVALGLVNALQFLPVLLFSLFGGVIADRVPKRWLLVGTQSAQMLLAFVLAILISTGYVQFWHILVLALLLGIANSLDMPTRQAFVIELVGEEDLLNAVALNSAVFNSARIIGPAVGGLAIGAFGTAGAFYLNGVSFIPVVIGLTAMRLDHEAEHHSPTTGSVLENLKEGLQYISKNHVPKLIIVMTAIIGTFGMNLSVIVPLLARDVLGLGAQDYGFLMSGMGVGSLTAAVLVMFALKRPRIRALLLGGAGLGLLSVLLAFSTSYLPMLLLLAGLGFFMVIYTAVANAALQTASPAILRGRVMSAYTTVFIGTTPLGNLWAGAMAEHFGTGSALFWGGIISLATILWGWRYALSVRNRSS